ncbi:MAG: hypothetical protein QOI00_1953 [Chloroflexota bacterium]|nr:hypothetical protein [Chloroflexota bacterium]
MDAIVFRVIATGLPILGLLGLLAAALWALRQWLTDRVNARRDRFAAVLIATLLGLAFGAGILVIGVGLASMDGPAPGVDAYLRYLPIGLLFAAPVAVGAIAGYVALVRTRLARVALIGTFVGSAAVIGLAGVGGSVVSSANNRLFDVNADQEAAVLAARSSVLVLSVGDVHVETDGAGTTVKQIRLRVAVAATADVRIATGGKSTWPRFSMREIGNYPILDAPTPASPTVFAAGSTSAFDLTFDAPQLSDGGQSRFILASTYVEPTPGDWVLTMQLEDETGQWYEVTAPVSISATP